MKRAVEHFHWDEECSGDSNRREAVYGGAAPFWASSCRSWWAKAYRFANFSVGGLHLGNGLGGRFSNLCPVGGWNSSFNEIRTSRDPQSDQTAGCPEDYSGFKATFRAKSRSIKRAELVVEQPRLYLIPRKF